MYKNYTLFLVCFLWAFRVGAQNKNTQVLENIQQKLTWNTSKESLLVYINTMDKMTSEKPNPYTNYWNAYAKYLLYFEFNLKNEEENSGNIDTLTRSSNNYIKDITSQIDLLSKKMQIGSGLAICKPAEFM